MRWVHRYAPELEKRVRWYQGYRATSWRVDETYVKVGGRWKYLFRAVDKHGRLIDFMLADRRNTRAAHRFLGKALTTMRHWPPTSITTDQLGSYPKAICRLQRGGFRRHKTPDLQIPEQHHRSRPWRTQTSHSSHPRLSDDEDSGRDDQGLRSDAYDSSRALPHM
jgi:transposase-like protein